MLLSLCVLPRWTELSTCEESAEITRTRPGVPNSNFTVSHRALSLACFTAYTPNAALIDEKLTEPGLDVGATYSYCVQSLRDQGKPVTALDPTNKDVPALTQTTYSSRAVCVNKTIEWSSLAKVRVETDYQTPVPGINVTASVTSADGRVYAVSQLTDQGGIGRLLMQTDIIDCSGISQVRLVAGGTRGIISCLLNAPLASQSQLTCVCMQLALHLTPCPGMWSVKLPLCNDASKELMFPLSLACIFPGSHSVCMWLN